MAPIRIIVNPHADNLIKNARRTAVAPNGSAMVRSLVVNNKNGDRPSGALDQKGNL